MRGWWQRLLGRQSPAPDEETEWHVMASGQLLARLRAPEPEDMFWFSFQIVPASEPADPRLVDERFWAGDGWCVLGAASGREIGPVIASIQGLDHQRQRVRLRGVLR